MNLLGKGNDPRFWSETVRNEECYKEYRSFLHSSFEGLCNNKTIESPKYSDFRLYAVNGDRNTFQGPYYLKRVQAETAVILSLIYPEEEKYLNYAMDALFAICNEYSWCIPAHLPKLTEVHNRTHLDLFACETAYMLSEVYTLLEDRLDPLIKARIRREVEDRVLKTFIRTQNWGWAKTNKSNWAAVCAGSVGCSFMLLRPDLFPSVKEHIDYAIENFLSGYNDDGYCLEGTHYWHYGFGFFLSYAEMLRTFTGGKENYFQREKVHKIATFLQKMFLTENKGVSFADAHEGLDYHIGILHFLKTEYNDVKVYDPKYSYINDECGRFTWLVRAATWLDPKIYYSPDDINEDSEYYGEYSQWFTKKTQSYGFAAKGGFNNEHHNHNDVGAFIIAKNGKHIVTDPGRGEYRQQYFDKATRYTLIECSSLGHSVPYFGDVVQKFGDEYSSKDTSFKNGVFYTDIAGAYGDERIRSVKRSFSFSKSSVTLNDVFDISSDLTITERLILKVKPEVNGSEIVCDDLKIKLGDEVKDVSFSETKTTSGKRIFLLDLLLSAGADRCTLIFE
ncbi:MAG: heparinase II/III family protein [Clostridia bacterium]|nr:heparinase II/III family protein [Clostridia bacterium]